MAYPTAAVTRLEDWTTANFDQLSTDAIIQEFHQVAQDFSEAVTFVLDEVTTAATLAQVVADATDYRDTTLQHRNAADTARAGAVTAREAAEAAETAAETAQAETEGLRDNVQSYLGELNPAFLEYLYATEENQWLPS